MTTVPSAAETSAVAELLRRLTPAELDGCGFEGEPHDRKALRFVRARQGNAALAEQMIKKVVKWRVEFGVDKLVAAGESAALGFELEELLQFCKCCCDQEAPSRAEPRCPAGAFVHA